MDAAGNLVRIIPAPAGSLPCARHAQRDCTRCDHALAGVGVYGPVRDA
jgi:hypothetical protein